jgi:hypothetical protein
LSDLTVERGRSDLALSTRSPDEASASSGESVARSKFFLDCAALLPGYACSCHTKCRLKSAFYLVHQFVGDIPDLLSQFGAVERGNLVTERQAVPFQAAGSCRQWDNGRRAPGLAP